MGRKLVNGYEAKRTRLSLDGVMFCVEDVDINEEPLIEEDTTCSEDSGPKQEVGDIQLSGSINYTWDAADNPYSGAPILEVGRKIAALWYVHSSTTTLEGPFWDFTLQIIRHSHANPVRGKIAGTIEFKSFGAVTSYPNQSDVISSG